MWSYPNLHGTITATATATGVKQGTAALFDPFGNSSTLPDNLPGNFDLGWTGSVTEHGSGLTPTIEMGARQYSTVLGRFLSVDPILGGSANDYDYVHGDPVNRADTTGMCDGNDIWGCIMQFFRGVREVLDSHQWWDNDNSYWVRECGWITGCGFTAHLSRLRTQGLFDIFDAVFVAKGTWQGVATMAAISTPLCAIIMDWTYDIGTPACIAAIAISASYINDNLHRQPGGCFYISFFNRGFGAGPDTDRGCN